MDGYAQIGLSDNPFQVQSLRADEVGERLLVGRNIELATISRALHKSGKIACLDGHVGVGKTSLVNVATYKLFKKYERQEETQLLMPLPQSFQLAKDEKPEEFVAKAFRAIAAGIVYYKKWLLHLGLNVDVVSRLDALLNSPTVNGGGFSWQANAGVGVPGTGVGARVGSGPAVSVNTSSSFNADGVERVVRTILADVFTSRANGGFVCVIDNLELLESASNARRTLEALRDRLFNLIGVRWVFCGANGVVQSLAASTRLGAFLHTPVIQIKNISQDHIRELIETRIREYSISQDGSNVELPILMSDLEDLYGIVNNNLRDLLSLVDEYCELQFSNGNLPNKDSHRQKRFSRWLERNTVEQYKSLSSRVSDDSWVILDIAMSDKYKGVFGKTDHTSFSGETSINFAADTWDRWIRNFVKLGVFSRDIESGEEDEESFKRDVYTVTAKGALVHFARLNRRETKVPIPVTWKRVHW